MDKIFAVNIILSFSIAGTWIAFSSLLAERLGSKVGGLIANLPSNILVSLIFVSFVNDVEYVANAVTAVPLGLINVTVFLLVFIMLLKYGLFVASFCALFAWFVGALLMNQFGDIPFSWAIFMYFIFAICAILFLEKILKVKNVHFERKHYTVLQIAGRAIFSGSIVAGVVIISKFSPPSFTGIFSTFPAMLFTTLFILTKKQGIAFARATGKILVLSTTNTLIYAVAVHFTYPVFGVFLGTVLSYLTSVIWIWLLFPIVKRLS